MDPIELEQSNSPSFLKRALIIFLWSLLTLFLLLFFTLQKLPQTKIQNAITGTINKQLDPYQIQLTSDRGKLHLGLGVSYELTGVRLLQLSTQKLIKVEKIEVELPLLALIQMKKGAYFKIQEGAEQIQGKAFLNGENFELDLNTDKINLGKLGLLPFFFNLNGTSEVKIKASLRGHLKSLSSYEGTVSIGLSKTLIDQQRIMEFPIPQIRIDHSSIDLQIQKNQILIQKFQMGSPGGRDDISLGLTGSAKLGRTPQDTELNLRGALELSQSFRSGISSIEPFLANLKKPDGTYSFKLNGTMRGIILPQPD